MSTDRGLRPIYAFIYMLELNERGMIIKLAVNPLQPQSFDRRTQTNRKRSFYFNRFSDARVGS